MKAQTHILAGILILIAIVAVAAIGLSYTGQVIDVPETEGDTEPEVPVEPEPEEPEPEQPTHTYAGIKTILDNPEDFADREVWITGSLKRPAGNNEYYLEDGEDNSLRLEGMDFSGSELNIIYEARSLVVSERLCRCSQEVPIYQWVEGGVMVREECEDVLNGTCRPPFIDLPNQDVTCDCLVIKLNKYYWKDLGTVPAETCESMEDSKCEPTSIEYSEPHVVVFEMNQL
jgi:hypothetical protein